jgi:hypothetical protein
MEQGVLLGCQFHEHVSGEHRLACGDDAPSAHDLEVTGIGRHGCEVALREMVDGGTDAPSAQNVPVCTQ